MNQAFPVPFGQFQPGDVDHQWAMRKFDWRSHGSGVFQNDEGQGVVLFVADGEMATQATLGQEASSTDQPVPPVTVPSSRIVPTTKTCWARLTWCHKLWSTRRIIVPSE